MFMPQQFAEMRLEVLQALIRSRPLGTWVATVGGELIANHVPFLLDETRGPHGTLSCHVARPNPVVAHARSALTSVVCFNGTQGYVTPSWYPGKQAHGKAVPTWNYAVVHAHGQATFIDDRDWLLQHVVAITASQEATREQPWKVGDAPASYIEQNLRGIIGVEIRIERIEGKWKVSQNQPEANRRGVVEGLLRQGDAESVAMAALVKQNLPDDTSRSAGMHSANLALRLPRADDAAFILELLNDPDWLRNIGDRGVRNEADAVRYIRERLLCSFDRHGFGLWVVEPRTGGNPLGLCGLVKREHLDDVDIGFAFLPVARGKGNAVEAARRVLQFAREDLRLARLVGLTLPGNTASIRVLTQLGLAFEKTMADGDEPVDLYALRIT